MHTHPTNATSTTTATSTATTGAPRATPRTAATAARATAGAALLAAMVSVLAPAAALTSTAAAAAAFPAPAGHAPATHGPAAHGEQAPVLGAGPEHLRAGAPARHDLDPLDRFGWPLAGFPGVLRPFDPPEGPYGPGHRGVDLGGTVDQPVLAAGTGVVVFAGVVAGKPVVSVDHPNGLRTTYEPVVATVTPGQPVARGDQLGTLQPGHPGCPAAACLHWGVRRGTEYLDPLRLLAQSPVRLLPTT